MPALDQTDNLLNLLANDSHTLQQLTANSDTVITALANNSANVERFITEAAADPELPPLRDDGNPPHPGAACVIPRG